MSFLRKALSLVIALILVGSLGSCARYQVTSNRVGGHEVRITRLAVWSSLGNINLLEVKTVLYPQSFTERFDAALRQGFQSEGISTDVNKFLPKAINSETIALAEKEFRPDYRLTIQPTRFQTTTTSKGTVMLSGLWLDLRLHDVATGALVWRGSLDLDPGFDPTTWLDSGASKLVSQIIEALKNDKLIPPGRPFSIQSS